MTINKEQEKRLTYIRLMMAWHSIGTIEGDKWAARFALELGYISYEDYEQLLNCLDRDYSLSETNPAMDEALQEERNKQNDNI